MPNFTFLVPTYKSTFFKESLSSILAQSFKDYSVIVSDDCSPEPIKEVVDSFAEYPNISYRRNETNIGAEHLVDHWNLLLSMTDAEFVIIAGDDDRYHPNFLEKIYTMTEKYPSCNLFCTGLNMIDQFGKTLRTYYEPDGLISFESYVSHLVDPNAILCMGNLVFRRSALLDICGFVNFPLAWKSDSASQIAVAGNGVASSSEKLFDFRMSGANLSSRTAPDFKKDALKFSAIISFDNWAKNNCYPYVSVTTKYSIRRKIEGELRMYLWTRPILSRLKVFRRLRKDGWFFRFRSCLSFLKCVISPSK